MVNITVKLAVSTSPLCAGVLQGFFWHANALHMVPLPTAAAFDHWWYLWHTAGAEKLHTFSGSHQSTLSSWLQQRKHSEFAIVQTLVEMFPHGILLEGAVTRLNTIC